MKNNVDQPEHYTRPYGQAIDVLKDALTREEFIGYLKGNMLKYLLRHQHKNGLEDVKKSLVYASYLKEEV